MRRFVLFLMVLVLVGLAAFAIWPRETTALVEGEPEGTSQSKEEGSSQLSESEPEPAAVSESEPESQSEPESRGDASEPESEEESQQEEESSATEPEPAADYTDDNWNLLLVNTTSPLPEGFNVELETIVDSYQVDKRIGDAVRKMFNHAKEDGINLMICSAYRAPSRQEELFQAKKQEFIDYGYDEESAAEATAAWIAYPGTSEHHTGLALDIVTPAYQTLDEGFAATPAFQWLDQHAAEYGFILRYPKDKVSITNISYEPWHYRYVGERHSQVVKEAGYCLEEYLYVLAQQKAEMLAGAAAEAGESEEQEEQLPQE